MPGEKKGGLAVSGAPDDYGRGLKLYNAGDTAMRTNTPKMQS